MTVKTAEGDNRQNRRRQVLAGGGFGIVAQKAQPDWQGTELSNPCRPNERDDATGVDVVARWAGK